MVEYFVRATPPTHLKTKANENPTDLRFVIVNIFQPRIIEIRSTKKRSVQPLLFLTIIIEVIVVILNIFFRKPPFWLSRSRGGFWYVLYKEMRNYCNYQTYYYLEEHFSKHYYYHPNFLSKTLERKIWIYQPQWYPNYTMYSKIVC